MGSSETNGRSAVTKNAADDTHSTPLEIGTVEGCHFDDIKNKAELSSTLPDLTKASGRQNEAAQGTSNNNNGGRQLITKVPPLPISEMVGTTTTTSRQQESSGLQLPITDDNESILYDMIKPELPNSPREESRVFNPITKFVEDVDLESHILIRIPDIHTHFPNDSRTSVHLLVKEGRIKEASIEIDYDANMLTIYRKGGEQKLPLTCLRNCSNSDSVVRHLTITGAISDRLPLKALPFAALYTTSTKDPIIFLFKTKRKAQVFVKLLSTIIVYYMYTRYDISVDRIVDKANDEEVNDWIAASPRQWERRIFHRRNAEHIISDADLFRRQIDVHNVTDVLEEFESGAGIVAVIPVRPLQRILRPFASFDGFDQFEEVDQDESPGDSAMAVFYSRLHSMSADEVEYTRRICSISFRRKKLDICIVDAVRYFASKCFIRDDAIVASEKLSLDNPSSPQLESPRYVNFSSSVAAPISPRQPDRQRSKSPSSPRILSYLKSGSMKKKASTKHDEITSLSSGNVGSLVSMGSATVPNTAVTALSPNFFIRNITGLWTSRSALQCMSNAVLVEPTEAKRAPPTVITENILADLAPYLSGDELDLNELSNFVVVTFSDISTPLVLIFRKQSACLGFIVVIQTIQKIFNYRVAMSDID